MHIEFGAHPAYKGILKELIDPLPADLETDGSLDDWLLRRVSTMHLISCTARMGPDSDPGAVVNQYGQVRGIDCLRVADISIMPDCPRANTNLVAILIGERIADFMRK